MDEPKKNILRTAGFKEQIDRIEHGFCPLCGKPICMEDFKDELSKKEFTISGTCQECQNGVFKGGE
jgi:hypothetical protein